MAIYLGRKVQSKKAIEKPLEQPTISENTLTSLEVKPKLYKQTYLPQLGYEGFNKVIVNEVDASIDPDIKPENIKKGVTILGVTGTLE